MAIAVSHIVAVFIAAPWLMVIAIISDAPGVSDIASILLGMPAYFYGAFLIGVIAFILASPVAVPLGAAIGLALYRFGFARSN